MTDVPRYMLVAGGLIMLILGMALGIAYAKGDYHCETRTHNGGVTAQETCVRDVTP